MKLPKKLIKEVESIEDLVGQGENLLNLAVQNLDLREVAIDWDKVHVANTTFLGCDMELETELKLREKGAIIYPKVVGLPYNPYRSELYSWQELLEGFEEGNDQSHDLKIYNHFQSFKNSGDVNEALCQRVHDHAIDDALIDLIGLKEDGTAERKCVGIMGGHSTLRTDPYFESVAKLTKKMTEEGYFMMSGGGPGIMEATNFGAYMAGKSEEDLTEALQILRGSPGYRDEGYNAAAQEVLKKFPEGAESLAIPTWFYGHEPSNLFATSIAKYFSNAIREDILLSAAAYGIVFAPGSAGTIQEIFTDAAQNYYASLDHISPMVFLGRDYWTVEKPVYEVVRKLAEGKKYYDMISISDEVDEIVEFIKAHPPVMG